MPVSVKKLPGRQRYRVSTPGGTKAKSTTKAKAERQQRLLNAIDHGWKPTGKHESMNTPNQIVKMLLGEDEHSDLYDQLLAMAEKDPEGDLMGYIDLIADIYNGGIEQCIEHGRDYNEFRAAASFLRQHGGPHAIALASAFRGVGRAYQEAEEKNRNFIEATRNGENDDPDADVFAEFAEDFDAVEELLYNQEATDGVHKELLAKLSQAPTVPANDNSPVSGGPGRSRPSDF